MIKYKLQVGGVPITSIQYKGEPIGHLHHKGTPYSYWENPPPLPEPEPPAPSIPLAVYRLTGDSVGMTRLTFNVAATNYHDYQWGIKASGYNYFAYQRQLSRGEWIDERSGTPASLKTGEVMVYDYKGQLVPEPVESSSTPPTHSDSQQQRVWLSIKWLGRREGPSLSFVITHVEGGNYGITPRLSYSAVASFNVNGECVSAQDSSYTSTQQGHGLTTAQRPTLTRSGASFRVRNGAWVRLLKVSG